MSTHESDTRPETDDAIEFYVPATFQFSTETGRIERLLVGLFHDADRTRDRSGLEARIVTERPTREFYTPAMYQFSTEKGRIERFLETIFAERGERTSTAVPEAFLDVFYLPAVDPDAFRDRDPGTLDDVPVRPADKILQGDGRPPEPSG